MATGAPPVQQVNVAPSGKAPPTQDLAGATTKAGGSRRSASPNKIRPSTLSRQGGEEPQPVYKRAPKAMHE
eukprot:5202063-Pyramimonas_sp.AAC.1